MEDDSATDTYPPTGSPQSFDDRGSIDIFTSYPVSGTPAVATEFPGGYSSTSPSITSDPPLRGIPFNTANGFFPPRVIITQQERYYPQVGNTYINSNDTVRPQYVWDCMFRRFEGKILVAIFVYRVGIPGGGTPHYIVPPNPPPNSNVPPIPIWLDLRDPATIANACADGPWSPGGPDNLIATNTPGANPVEQNDIVLGTPSGIAYNADDARQAWQEPRQWILDQNNCIHRVVGQYRADNSDDVEIQLARAVPGLPGPPGVQCYYFALPPFTGEPVTDIWYLPRSVDGSAFGSSTWDITPIYVTVKEL
jgi:hypothetical protein